MPTPQSLFLTDDTLALATDLYQLTMMAGYRSFFPERKATFELSARKLPYNRSYLIACGLEQVVHYLQNLQFSEEAIAFLKELPVFARTSVDFWQYLRDFRFAGDLWAMPEGTPFFPNQPILRVTAPIAQAQLFESYLLSVINLETSVASKAARMVIAASGKPVFEFGLRRAHGPQAAMLASRAAYIAGCAGTSNILAGVKLGIPLIGTMAHSWVMSYQSEEEAFRQFQSLYPETTLLIDTYDIEAGAHHALTSTAASAGELKGVRIDSGDLAQAAHSVRTILDRAGQTKCTIAVSGDLDEEIIAKLIRLGAPVDIFAVGTAMVVSRDAPSLNVIYKLVEIADPWQSARPVAKASQSKSTLAGVKQVCRFLDAGGKYKSDTIALAEADQQEAATELLTQIMQAGELVKDLPTLEKSRNHCQSSLKKLDPALLLPEKVANTYRVVLSPKLQELQAKLAFNSRS